MKIAFHSNQLSLRGSEIALYDYAFFNRTLLGNESVVVFDKNSKHNNPDVIKKFEKEFPTVSYENFADVDSIIGEHGADLLYCIKSGKRDGKISGVVPTMVHAVFPTALDHVHGAAFAFVSDWLSLLCSNGKAPAVPHMVHLPALGNGIPKDLRSELNIPDDATVFGSYGGADSFDIPFVKSEAIPEALRSRADVHFLFLNIDKFIEHPRVMFLPGSSSLEYKTRFINTTDGMLHARLLGESFGLACAEFAILNKPILTYAKSRDRNHLMVLGEHALSYSSARDLLELLLSFDRREMAKKHWDFYSQTFNPENVMRLFDKNLIRNALSNGLVEKPPMDFPLHERIRSRVKLLRTKLG